jgi:hypothetical protein
MAYIEHHSNKSNVYALFSGFTFASITVLLTQLPDPTQIHAQMILFILSVMLDHFLYTLYSERIVLSNCVRVAPPIPEKWHRLQRTAGWEDAISGIIVGLSVVLMFFLWGLLRLALASVIALALIVIRAYINYLKPYFELAEKTPWIRK